MPLENVSKCPSCSSNRLRVLMTNLRDVNEGLLGEFNILQCVRCGICFTTPRPKSIEDAGSLYPSGYGPCSNSEYSGFNIYGLFVALLNLFGRFPRSERAILARDDKITRVLDVGCGNGSKLSMLRDNYDILGIEPVKGAVELCRKSGLKVVQGNAESLLELSIGRFNAIILSHSLEHVFDFELAMSAISQVLANAGWLLLTVPNFECVGRRMLREYWFPLEIPRHLYHFDAEFLKVALKEWSLKTHAVYYQRNPFTYSKSLLSRVVGRNLGLRRTFAFQVLAVALSSLFLIPCVMLSARSTAPIMMLIFRKLS